MLKYLLPLLIILLLSTSGISAHGDSHPDNEDSEDGGISLELLTLITAVLGIVLLFALSKIIDLQDRRLIVVMLATALVFLLLDYYYLKNYYYA